MQIAIIGPAYPFRGGIASFAERLATEFINEGHTVVLYTFTTQYPSLLFPGKTQISSDPPPSNLVIHRTIHSLQPITWYKTAKQIQQQAPQLLISQFWMPIMAMSLGSIQRMVAKNNKVRTVGIIHNLNPHEKRKGDKLFTSWYINSCTACLAMSKTVQNDIKQQYTNIPTAYNPHPIYDNMGDVVLKSVAKQHLNIANNQKIILFFGLIRKYKGLDLLLEAMCDEGVKNEHIKLLVAGECYENEREYKQFIAENQLQNHVTAKFEFIPNSEVKYYFCAADLVVQPYKTATQSGISQMAYHFNKPMLVTNVGGLPEIVPHGKVGYVVEPNKTAIAKAIIDFYKNDKENIFVQNIAEEKKRFMWNTLTSCILNL